MADTSSATIFYWQVGRTKEDIPSHDFLYKYNHSMQGGDHHDQLRALFATVK
jgi:hypothetical protein